MGLYLSEQNTQAQVKKADGNIAYIDNIAYFCSNIPSEIEIVATIQIKNIGPIVDTGVIEL